MSKPNVPLHFKQLWQSIENHLNEVERSPQIRSDWDNFEAVDSFYPLFQIWNAFYLCGTSCSFNITSSYSFTHFVWEFSKTYTGIKFGKVDVDANDETAATCGVSAMPTFQFYLNGEKFDELVGASVEKLKAMLEKLNGQ